MSDWSKLQKALYQITAPRIDFQIHCTAYRMKSQHGGVNLPRYFVTLGKNIIFDYPKEFVQDNSELSQYPYTNEVSEISNIIREYIDTPVNEIFSENFANDKWELTEILKAADRRIGQRRLDELFLHTKSQAAKAVITARSSLNI